MNRIRGVLFLGVLIAATPAFGDSETRQPENTTTDEFLKLETPDRNIDGAYYGLGITLSRISHKVKAIKNDRAEVNLKKTGNQFDISLIGGFGSAFYKRYYAGIEMELFKRFAGKTNYDGEIGIVHASTVGLNMDIRFGYLFPKQGALIYLTAGCARVLGRVAFNNSAAGVGRRSKNPEGSFGSFYPTFGVGIEKKINHLWNARADFRISLTSKDDNKYKTTDAATWKYEAQPNKAAFRISIVRNI
ncbi:MAG: hypothetical protein LBO02_02960 [Holosporaceae bacterium]|jgi:hypothetical protein|nr:hypothetical protein [Holosporaceae bacterium]